ncbi:metallophosphoesterase [Sphingomonas sp. RB56-2]|uniref:Metallophosphoesterase n=1 Tax=Sphingomonas brevis TaxID=2908206 RepID=A0ABT0S7N8_9SPHN|nr:metallophosphoesterase [Sphingomonas brevis]MCL6740404.1 metallophosphoesterase [Sphingomonas brevis]
MFRQRQRPTNGPTVPRGYRAYAVGDVHGRLDLLDQLLLLIEQDVELDPARKSLLIFLGDLVDRGPDSQAVVDRLRTYRHSRLQPYFLTGNHEEVLLRLLAGERGILDSWLKYGGGECLRSYGMDPASLSGLGERAALECIGKAIPVSHSRFIGSFADTLTLGDYLFVHAGIRPGIDLSLQSQADLRWIRSPFLECEDDHGMIVIHGHTISEGVDDRGNRIGLDTGAYRSHVLTAMALEDDRRWIIDTAVAGPKQAAGMP